MKFIISILLIVGFVNSQNIIELESVPEEFQKKYLQEDHDWNPLWVGNYWQYILNGELSDRFIEKDTIINGKQYFKKVDYLYDRNGRFYMWERINFNTLSTYSIDLFDINDNGNINEELLLDSLETDERMYEFPSHRFIYPQRKEMFSSIPYGALVWPPKWYQVFGDTVLTREISYGAVFQSEVVADGFGPIIIKEEGAWLYLRGAIIYGEEYGTIVSVDENVETKPTRFLLGNNYPNPFNPSTTITYSIPKLPNQSLVKIRLLVFDTLGRVITTLVDEKKPSGTYSIIFNAKGLASGVYYYSFISESNVITKPMLLIK